MLTPEQRFQLWRVAMTDAAMMAGRFALTKQDLRAAIDAIDDDFGALPKEPDVVRLAQCVAHLPEPVVDEQQFAPREYKDGDGRLREPTKNEKANEPKRPQRAGVALNAEQLRRLHELVSAWRQAQTKTVDAESRRG